MQSISKQENLVSKCTNTLSNLFENTAIMIDLLKQQQALNIVPPLMLWCWVTTRVHTQTEHSPTKISDIASTLLH